MLSVLPRKDPTVPHKDHPLQPKPLLQVFDHPLHRLSIPFIAGEQVMGDGPAVDQHQPHQYLSVVGLFIPAVLPGKDVAPTPRAPSFEVSGGRIVEGHLHFQGE